MRANAPPSDLRSRVLDATDRLLARYGYRKMTVDDIAAEAGIGKGTVYLAFSSKEDVALSCIDRMVDGLLAELGTPAGPAPRAQTRHAPPRPPLSPRPTRSCPAV